MGWRERVNMKEPSPAGTRRCCFFQKLVSGGGGGAAFLENSKADPFSQRPQGGAACGGVGGRCHQRGCFRGELRRKNTLDTLKVLSEKEPSGA